MGTSTRVATIRREPHSKRAWRHSRTRVTAWFRLVARVHERHGIAWTSVDLRDLSALEGAWRDETRLVWIESPTNPALSIVDIEPVCGFAHAREAGIGPHRAAVQLAQERIDQAEADVPTP